MWRHLASALRHFRLVPNVTAPRALGLRLAAVIVTGTELVATSTCKDPVLGCEQSRCGNQTPVARAVFVKSRQEHKRDGKALSDGRALLFAPLVTCAEGFDKFAMSDSIVPFMRDIVRVIEEDVGLHSYHLRVVPCASNGTPMDSRRKETEEVRAILAQVDAGDVARASAACGFLIFAVGSLSGHRAKGISSSNDVPIVKGLSDLDAPIDYVDAFGKHVRVEGVTQRDVLAWEHHPDTLVRCGMDWQARPCLVVIMAPAAPAALRLGGAEHVRRQSELSDEEVFALWHTVGRAVQLHGGNFLNIRLNAGSFQNVAHLHVKIFLDEHIFKEQWGRNKVFQRLVNARELRKQP